jgi:hypothetical protein
MNKENNFIKKEDFLKDLLIILRETFEGSPAGVESVYLDKGVGVFNTLAGISAKTASAKNKTTSIAAHTEHLKFYLDRLCEFIGGRTEKVNWELSWLIETVTTEEWDILREGVKRSYENVLRCVAGVDRWDQDNMGDAIAILVHTAYHFGAIRQIIAEREN